MLHENPTSESLRTIIHEKFIYGVTKCYDV